MENSDGCVISAVSADDDHVVTVLPARIRISVHANETIVDALRRNGYRTRYKCRRGGCGACRATLIDGDIVYVTHVSTPVIDGHDSTVSSQKCLPCRATPTSDATIELGPRDRIVDVVPGLRRAPCDPADAPAHNPPNS
ncbi:MAG: 2Fe-2S iron-sulfur cluster binding domain-containing protein [Rhodococcus sp. (in: high G+C Gram-positive bacteria)]|nr:MAG: 2Fe-2S iron-sulfur cluster binding domain-containing protein [Rhodococcus sp. (in: high G+C Gram-positive bacteria)]